VLHQEADWPSANRHLSGINVLRLKPTYLFTPKVDDDILCFRFGDKNCFHYSAPATGLLGAHLEDLQGVFLVVAYKPRILNITVYDLATA
jgi:hypothetical protein